MEAGRFERPPSTSIEDALGSHSGNHRNFLAIPEPHRLDAYIPEEVRAIRDYDRLYTAGDVDGYLETISVFADPEGSPSQQACSNIVDGFRDTLQEEEGPAKTNNIFMMLAQSGEAVRRALEEAELNALDDPAVAKEYLRDLLVDSPHRHQPILVKELDAFTRFDRTEQRDNKDKVSITAKIVYLRHSTLTNEGLIDWFNDHQNPGYHPRMTPREIVDSGTDEEVETLVDWCSDSRAQIGT